MFVVASQVNSIQPHLRELAESFCFNGYRVGFTLTVSGSLTLLQMRLSWPGIYRVLALVKLVQAWLIRYSPLFQSLMTVRPSGFSSWKDSFIDPLKDLISRPTRSFFVAIMVLYRLGEGLWDSNKELFFLDMGIRKSSYAVLDVINLWFCIFSTFLSGFCIRAWGAKNVMRAGLIGYSGILMLLWWNSFASEKFLLSPLAVLENSMFNIALTGFFAFQTAYARPQYALVQLAWMTAIVNLSMKLTQMHSGKLVVALGWLGLLFVSLLMNIPALIVLWRVRREESL